ncbi:hypothetical protein K501DRAFT_269822 [Backusella circina FSU 941]|nr:hypothetical protein K501DRAFT_269822 [Backusella circina FSU 941]
MRQNFFSQKRIVYTFPFYRAVCFISLEKSEKFKFITVGNKYSERFEGHYLFGEGINSYTEPVDPWERERRYQGSWFDNATGLQSLTITSEMFSKTGISDINIPAVAVTECHFHGFSKQERRALTEYIYKKSPNIFKLACRVNRYKVTNVFSKAICDRWVPLF